MLNTDPEAFDCESCELRMQQAALGHHDLECLDLHHALSLPVVQDLRLTRLVFDIFGLQMTPEQARLTLDKLDLIHRKVGHPPQVIVAGQQVVGGSGTPDGEGDG